MASSATDSQNKDKNIRENLINTGCVDVIISVGNNFFYTKSLPCSLWLFDKAKNEAIRDKVLFIDARNYYTVVDRTLNEWSEWQLKNINAIVWLYRGEVEKYQNLLQEYKKTIHSYTYESSDNELSDILLHYKSFEELDTTLTEYIKKIHRRGKKLVEQADKRAKKAEQVKWDSYIDWLLGLAVIVYAAQWLYEKFGEGKYQNVAGLCKIADLEEIKSKGWSLTPGAYVGVPPTEDDGVDFTERMKEIHQELLQLQAESNDLMKTISENMKELGL